MSKYGSYEEALRASKKIWEALVATGAGDKVSVLNNPEYDLTDMFEDFNFCPMCEYVSATFGEVPDDDGDMQVNCSKCKLFSGKDRCKLNGSPYGNWARHKHSGDSKARSNLASVVLNRINEELK